MAQADALDSPRERPSARAWYALVVLIVSTLFALSNGRILSLLAGPIKQDLSLTDLQIGETHGLAPAIFATIAIYPLAWLADRFERRTVLCGCVIFWSLATAASGLAWNFLTLQACTIAIVVGEAGAAPMVYSLVADLFPAKYRARANIIVYGATVLGAGFTLTLVGALIGVVDDLRPLLPSWLSTLETWRLGFFFVAFPGPLIAFGVFLIGRTRRQAATPQEPAPMVPMRPYAREHGMVALGVYATMGLFSFALQGMATWVPIALIRTFKIDAASLGVTYGLFFMGGAAVGLVAAAILTPYYRRLAGTAFVLRAISFAAVGTAVPVLLLGIATDVWQCYALAFCWSAIFVTGVSLMPGMMQDVAPAALRTRVMAVGTVVYMVMGAISSPLIGFVSDQADGGAKGLLWSMIAAAVTGLLACSVLARFMENSYRRTVAAVVAA